MTHRVPPGRTLEVDSLARVEGEGAMYVEITDGEVRDVQLRIYEPPRFFEAFLEGRSFTEPPDITARICGICPVAYQTSACNAIEAACGVSVDGPLRELRRLLYFGEWIESHTLHVTLLHAPDFLGFDGAIEMASEHRGDVERGLRLKKAGNMVMETIGGRAIHPVNVRIGGFYRVPRRRELDVLRETLLVARDDAVAHARWVATFDAPELVGEWELVALTDPDDYAVLDGTLRSTNGLELGAAQFETQLVEEHVPHSTALHARLLERGHYLVGPLARYNLSFDRLSALTRELAIELDAPAPIRNPFRSIVVRALEVVHACDSAISVIEDYVEPDAPAIEVEPRAAVGHGWSEAPRGMLWHRYELTDDGTITSARIVPPTSQNQPTIEHDLFHYVERSIDAADEVLSLGAERVIRNHDPCISCATHFLDMTVQRS